MGVVFNMSLMNVLTDFPYRLKYYLMKPWKFFKELWQNLHAAYKRATRGYAWRDAAEMSEYMLHLIPAMLRDVAAAEAYPGTEPFETYEKWQNWCISLAELFESAQEENWITGRNEWEKASDIALEVLYPHPNLTTTHEMTEQQAKEVIELYWIREKELSEERQNIIKCAYAKMAEYHDYLWI